MYSSFWKWAQKIASFYNFEVVHCFLEEKLRGQMVTDNGLRTMAIFVKVTANIAGRQNNKLEIDSH